MVIAPPSSLPEAPPPKGHNHLALWGGLTALFTNLAGINLLILIGVDGAATDAVAAVITALTTAAAIYAKQRWDDERSRRQQDPPQM